MKDRYIIAIISALVLALIAVFYLTIDRGPFRWDGVPEGGITCGGHSDVRTCVGSGKVYTCVTNWRRRVVACAPASAVMR